MPDRASEDRPDPSDEEGTFEVVSPSGTQVLQAATSAAALTGFAGMRIAFLWDELFSGDIAFEEIAAEVRGLEPSVEFVSYQQFGNFHGSEDRAVLAALPALLAQQRIDAVIVGVGA